ncbi:MAG: hypothetical protein ACLUD0_06915 [Eubacterium ramulus]
MEAFATVCREAKRDAELEDVEEEAPVEEKEDLSTTKEMPDLKAKTQKNSRDRGRSRS